MNDSRRPIATGGCFVPSGRIAKATTQAPSHSDSCGHSRPHISGSVLVSRNLSAPARMSPSSSSLSAAGMSLRTGQASMQGAEGQSMQRAASTIAASRSMLRYVSSKVLNPLNGIALRDGLSRDVETVADSVRLLVRRHADGVAPPGTSTGPGLAPMVRRSAYQSARGVEACQHRRRPTPSPRECAAGRYGRPPGAIAGTRRP